MQFEAGPKRCIKHWTIYKKSFRFGRLSLDYVVCFGYFRKRRPQNLENEAPKTRKRSTLSRKRSTLAQKRRPKNLENEAPKTRNHCRLYVLHDAIRIRWTQRMRPHLQWSTKSIPRFYTSLPTVLLNVSRWDIMYKFYHWSRCT